MAWRQGKMGHPALIHAGRLALLTGLSWGISQAGFSLGFCSPAFFHDLALSLLLVLLISWWLRGIGIVWDRAPGGIRSMIREGAVPLLLTGLSVYLFRAVWRVDVPATFDHTTHLLRAWLTELAVRREGTLLPWTSAIGSGSPLNDLYPPGGVLVYCAARLLSLGFLAPPAAYKVTVFFSWLLLIGAVYSAGRYWFGVAGGAAAAFLILLDVGAMDLFGWGASFSIGVWPMALSGGLVIFALLLFIETLGRPAHPAWMGILALLAAASILAHVFSLLALLTNLFIVATVLYFHAPDRKLFLLTALRNACYVGLGALLSGWWLIPFLASLEWIQPYGSLLTSPERIAEGMWNGTLWVNTFPLFTFLMLGGGLWGLVSGRSAAVGLAVAAFVNWTMLQDVFYAWFPSEALTEYVNTIRSIRFAGYAKLEGAILAGGMLQPLLAQTHAKLQGLIQLIHGGTARQENGQGSASGIVSLVATLGLTAALMGFLPVAESVPRVMKHIPGYDEQFPLGHSEPELRWAFEQAMALIAARGPLPPGNSTFFLPVSAPRVGVRANHRESLIPLIYGYGIVPPPYMPTQVLSTRAAWTDWTSPALSHMKYFIGRGNRARVMAVPGMKEILPFGDYAVFENLNYRNDPFFILESSPGQARLEQMAPGYLAVSLEGFAHPVHVRFPVSRYRKWRAYENGKEIPILESIRPFESTYAGKFITVEAGNGRLELHYVSEPVDWAGRLVSLAAGMILIFRLVCPRFPGIQFPTITASNRFQFSHGIPTWCGPSALFGLILVGLLAAGIARPEAHTRFWFAGVNLDAVGTTGWGADRRQDLEFGLILGRECQGRVLEAVTLRSRRMGGTEREILWTSRPGEDWKAVLMGYDPSAYSWEKVEGEFSIPVDGPRFFRIFAGNRFQEQYVPRGTMVEAILHFADGGDMRLSCILPSRERY
ncbi:MAG TPA: hypothetical protein PLH79_10300 [bacterium]|nr:hypothetical protein [bacterium]